MREVLKEEELAEKRRRKSIRSFLLDLRPLSKTHSPKLCNSPRPHPPPPTLKKQQQQQEAAALKALKEKAAQKGGFAKVRGSK